MALSRVVAISGCDSGLGWAIAARAAREGLVTVAGMLQGCDTKAAVALRKYNALPYELDVTNPESIANFRGYVESLLRDNPNYKLHAIVNNAGVMTIGNYEWQTAEIIEQTVNVNLLGTMRMVSAFLPELRKAALENKTSIKPRLINVASHCGLYPLPAFGAYCATKAAVVALTQSLRMEHRNHGLSVVAFIPGGFVGQSSILQKQAAHGKTMLENLNEEQKSYYEKQVVTLMNYLGQAISHNVHPEEGFDSLNNEDITETFIKALCDKDPMFMYKVESWRYMFYYNLLKLPLPERMHCWLVNKFLNFPQPE